MAGGTLHIHRLSGCATRPLAHYLKALGLLRLVGEQRDDHARGWWDGDSFSVATRLTRNGLAEFLLHQYRPTPILAPWNGGSGFFPKDKKDGIDAIRSSVAERLGDFRTAIAIAEKLVEGRTEAPKKEEKAALIRALRSEWRGGALSWLDAAVVLNDDGSPSYPGLLGTGGNDGRLDFTNNFMQRLVDLFDVSSQVAPARPESADLLQGALWGRSTAGLRTHKIGQFHPGGAGGANSSNGFAGDALVNPWDFVLMLEGTVLFTCSLAKRSQTGASAMTAAPFAVGAVATGYGSAARTDESARGEQWMPLWSRPATSDEVQALLLEGRSRIGRRGATGAVDFARAVGRLGVARGIGAFERFAYIERNGQSNLATPLGRWTVSPRPHQDLLDEVAGWIGRLRRIAHDPNAPATFSSASRRCDEAMLRCCGSETASDSWQQLLRSLAMAERLAVHSPAFAHDKALPPLPDLGVGWLNAANDGSPEHRIAVALASARVDTDPSGRRSEAVRSYWLPLEEQRGRIRFAAGQRGVETTPRQVCHGEQLPRDLVALVRRRARECSEFGGGTLGIRSRVPLDDLGAFSDWIDGRLDDRRVLELALALMAVDWQGAPAARIPGASASYADADPVQGLLHLAVPASPLPEATGQELGLGPLQIERGVIEHLAAGRLPSATQIALRRVRACGGRPKLRLACGSEARARRSAAALAIPLSNGALTCLIRLALKPELIVAQRNGTEDQSLRRMS